MFEKVRDTLAKQLHIDAFLITRETKIMEDLHADSIDILELLMTIEEEYGVTLPDEELRKFRTVGDVADYLDAHK